MCIDLLLLVALLVVLVVGQAQLPETLGVGSRMEATRRTQELIVGGLQVVMHVEVVLRTVLRTQLLRPVAEMV